MSFVKKNFSGLFLCFLIALPSWYLGRLFPVIGGAIIAIIAGMAVTVFFKEKGGFEPGIRFTSKKILQWAVVLLGFGMDLSVILQIGRQSLPIIISIISTSLVIAYMLHRAMKIPARISTLVGVGSSICGGSAIAATAPVIEATDEEVAQSISVIFFFNVLAALIFPVLGGMLGFSATDGNGFGVFAGTAVNDTSSVTAAASTWDSIYGLGSETLDTAVTVKLTRTLAIIPITLVLAFIRTRSAKRTDSAGNVSMKKIFPFFILFFVGASLITTLSVSAGADITVFSPLKELSKFFIIMAMAAIGLNTDIVKLIRTGGKPLVLGFCCWTGITAVSLLMQHVLGIW